VKNFIPWLKEKRENADDPIDSGSEIEPAEKVLGEMNTYLRELYTILHSLKTELEMEVDHLREKYDSPEAVPDERLEKLELRADRMEALEEFFYHEVRNEFGMYECLGLRENFTVVTWKREKSGAEVHGPSPHILAAAALHELHEEIERGL